MYLVLLLLHGIGNLLAYVVALYVTSVCRLLSVRVREGRRWRLQVSRSEVRSLYVTKFHYFEAYFYIFRICVTSNH